MADKTFEDFVEERAAVTIADADEFVVRDDSAADVKKITLSSLKSAMSLQHNGTAGAPSYSFASDPDTGMYRSGTNTLAFSTGNATRLTIASTGNVGIGTTSPSKALDVVSSGTTELSIRSTTSVGDSALLFGNVDDTYQASILYDASAQSLNLRGYNNTTRLTIANSGTVSTVGDITAGGDIITADGSSAAPSHTFASDPNTGMYRHNADDLAFTTGGSRRMSMHSSGVYSFVPFVTGNGTAAAPSHSFFNDPSMGMYRSAASTIGFTTGNATRFKISPTVVEVITATFKANLIGAQTGDYLGIGAGETSGQMSGNLSGEHLWLGAEGNINLVSTDDNWASGWAGRNETHLQPQSTGELRVVSDYGYIDIGPKNSSYCHIYTDRNSFYFNKVVNMAALSVCRGTLVCETTVALAAPLNRTTTSGSLYTRRETTFGTLVTYSSTRGHKENVQSLDPAESGRIIDMLRPVTYIEKFRSGPDGSFVEGVADNSAETADQYKLREWDIEYGFIAEELDALEPEGVKLASYDWQEIDDEGFPKPAGWKDSNVTAILVAEVKELRKRITALEGLQ